MVNITGNEIRRDGDVIGYIDGGYLYSYASRSSYVDLDKINAGISGGVLPEIGKCAIYEFLGE